MDALEISEVKILRGDVIEKLYMTYGTDIRIAALRNALRSKGLIPEESLKKCIFYLGGEGKRYIHVEVNKENWMDSVIWLTPAGVNLAGTSKPIAFLSFVASYGNNITVHTEHRDTAAGGTAVACGTYDHNTLIPGFIKQISDFVIFLFLISFSGTDRNVQHTNIVGIFYFHDPMHCGCHFFHIAVSVFIQNFSDDQTGIRHDSGIKTI